MDKGEEITVIDTQPKNIYDKGHIKGAVSIPWKSQLALEDVWALPSGIPIVTYCACGPGEADSADFARQLMKMGYNDVKDRIGIRNSDAGSTARVDETTQTRRFDHRGRKDANPRKRATNEEVDEFRRDERRRRGKMDPSSGKILVARTEGDRRSSQRADFYRLTLTQHPFSRIEIRPDVQAAGIGRIVD